MNTDSVTVNLTAEEAKSLLEISINMQKIIKKIFEKEGIING